MKIDVPALYKIFLKHPQITIDSRKVVPGSMFFALKGENFDGNRFASDALAKGAAYAVIDDESLDTSHAYLLVDDVLKTLQELAIFHRRRIGIPVIGITGSNGKTTTKELIGRVLVQKYKTFATTGNLNNHIGVPLSVLAIDESHEIAVIEMGANHQGEIAALCKISMPTHGIITNIGKAHLEGFGGYQGVIKAKGELYDYIRDHGGELFVHAGDELLMKLSHGISRNTYGTTDDADFRGEIRDSFPFLSANLFFSDKMRQTDTRLVGAYNFSNIMAAACIGEYFNVPAGDIAGAIQNYNPQNNRSQLIKTSRNEIVMDAYNANPSSMEQALRNFARSSHDNKMLILGDMLELGQDSAAEHRQMLELALQLGFRDMLLVGKEFSSIAAGLQHQTFASREEAMEFLSKNPPAGRFILIKGSRGIGLEKLLEVL